MKRVVGEVVTVTADVICDGHDQLAAVLRWHEPGAPDSGHEVRMRPLGNDRYAADLPLTRIGAYEYGIEAWRDAFGSFKDELAKKHAAGVDVHLELQEGVALLARTAAHAKASLAASVKQTADMLTSATDEVRLQTFLSPELTTLMQAADDRPRAASLPRPVRIDAERSGAAFAAWYEVFPRSMSDDPNRHGTFRDVERHLPRIRAMGFDVLYFPPRLADRPHQPQGPQQHADPHRGRRREPLRDRLHGGRPRRDPPAIGHGRTISAIWWQKPRRSTAWSWRSTIAIQCSPDHPWLKQHREWFDWRPDGSIKYAENPPKKYQDIVNVDFYAEGSIPGPLGGAGRGGAVLVQAGRAADPRGQPAHQAAAVLALDDRRRARALPGRGVPRRGVHPARR